MKKILLIGGAGFIGSHLKSTLLNRGYEVIIGCRNLPANKDPAVTYLSLAKDNMAPLESILPECSHVVHLASATTPGTSMLEPSKEVINNILPIAHLLEAMQKYHDIHLIFVSSGGAIYGNTHQDLVREDTLSQPLSYYGASKTAIEAFLYTYQKQTNNPVTILRPSNLYGSKQPLKTHFGIIPTIFNCLINDSVFEIWGDGEIIRDYLYIDDFIDLCIRIIQAKNYSHSYRIFNAGSGKGLSINHICNQVESITGKSICREYTHSRSVDVKKIVLNSSKVQSEFNWQASTSIKTGLEKTWENFQ